MGAKYSVATNGPFLVNLFNLFVGMYVWKINTATSEK